MPEIKLDTERMKQRAEQLKEGIRGDISTLENYAVDLYNLVVTLANAYQDLQRDHARVKQDYEKLRQEYYRLTSPGGRR